MQRFRFPLAVAVTSLALVLALVGAGGLLVSNALAIGPFAGGGPGAWSGAPWAAGHAGWQTNALPPELAGLTEVPAGERFAHLRGVRVQLTDKDNKPLTIDVTPGTATTVSPTSLTVTANDGSTHTYSLDDKTIIHARSGAHDSSSQVATSTLSQNDKVIVATLNNSATATAVVAVDSNGFGPRGSFGR
jgi:hypothetical protein